MKALIIGIIGNEAHEELVRDMFVLAYNNSGGNITTADVGIRSTASLDFQGGFDYCKANNIPIMICSYTGAINQIDIAQSNYPDITLIMVAGANSSTLVFNKPIPNVILITGGGDSDTGNETGYNIELFSNDYTTPETTPDEQDLSSYSNGYIAGQILYIADSLNCSIWEARYRAMQTGSENGTWHQINGYGFINVADAIAYSGAIPTDPFLIACTITANNSSIIIGEEVTLTWSSSDADIVKLNNEVVAENGSVVKTPSETTTYTLEVSNSYASTSSNVNVIVNLEEIEPPNNSGELEMGTQNIFTGIIQELEVVESGGNFIRSGLLTDANLTIKAEPIKKRLSNSDVVVGYNVEFTAELAEVKTLEDLKKFNNKTCTILFDTQLGGGRTLDTLVIANGEFIPIFNNVRLNISPELDFSEPGKSLIKLSGTKRVKDLYNNVFIFDEATLTEIKGNYDASAMDFNYQADIDFNTTTKNYDFNN